VAANDLMALGAMNAARARGLVIGKDLSVAGFDDIPTAEMLGLTTLNQPIYEIGRQLSQMLLAVMRGGGQTAQNVILKPSLVLRASVGPPA
jgi:DNA-binding LacI/PurR family transcriptional regulator